MDLDPGGMGGVEISWKIVLGQTGLIFFTAFADGFGPRGWERVKSIEKWWEESQCSFSLPYSLMGLDPAEFEGVESIVAQLSRGAGFSSQVDLDAPHLQLAFPNYWALSSHQSPFW